MAKLLPLILLNFGLIAYSSAFFNKAFKARDLNPNPGKGAGDPLFLTPLIEAGKFDEAKKLAKVTGLPNAPTLESYAGYFTVNKTTDSNIFGWFFPAQSKDPNASVLLWLQGGPGGTSMFGLFAENGPFVIDKTSSSATLRPWSWNKFAHVIYVDQPVGTGWSFTNDTRGYVTNEDEVARDMFEMLTQFFTLFSEYSNNIFYLTGESYAGKYIPAIGYAIDQAGTKANMNFQGAIIGDGWTDPLTQSDYSDYLYQIGLLNENERDYMYQQQQLGLAAIQSGDYIRAFKIFDDLLDGDLSGRPSFLKNVTGSTNYYNYMMSTEPADFEYWVPYLTSDAARKAIHVGNTTFGDGNAVEKALMADVQNSVKPYLEHLLDSNYRILLYSGQLDIIVAAPLTEKMISTFNWHGAIKWAMAKKEIWRMSPTDPNVTGYRRQVDNFAYVIVRNAGHILPYDQPEAAYRLVYEWV